MGTPFTRIYDLALIVIRDYRIDNLKNTNLDNFLTYMRGLLTSGMPNFTGNMQSLEYTSQEETNEQTNETSTVYYFVNTLSQKEESILAEAVVYTWVQVLINDVTVFQPHLSIKEFKSMEVSNGIKQRSEYLDKLYEKIPYDIEQYQFSSLSSLPFWGK